MVLCVHYESTYTFAIYIYLSGRVQFAHFYAFLQWKLGVNLCECLLDRQRSAKMQHAINKLPAALSG